MVCSEQSAFMLRGSQCQWLLVNVQISVETFSIGDTDSEGEFLPSESVACSGDGDRVAYQWLGIILDRDRKGHRNMLGYCLESIPNCRGSSRRSTDLLCQQQK